ncbi:unnamed protein product [Polarella glacialis]|uniref:Protein PsbN n=1 Tax=Polarella glacialis TaxID=89957 RepID=A0A813ERT4_POLGL|nr:unnamed protein product [Polarella glacialis]|mmetsp:Transcript_10018/g.18225  ORF Transcript_10018/g.18225 Transcript_10018/m.18225 type:complete len:118 (-) Transcript_10018:60-413(-)
MAARRPSSLVPLLLCVVAVTLCLDFLQSLAFAGSVSRLRGASELRTSGVSRAAFSEYDQLMAAAPDASSMVLADSLEAIPLVAFLVSVFVGIIGYSVYTAFGPGAAELRDPFEEHED